MFHKMLLLLLLLAIVFSSPVFSVATNFLNLGTSQNAKQVSGGSTSFRTHLSSTSSDYHLKNKRQNPQVPDGAIILDPETCYGKEGESTRLALQKTAVLARMAAVAAYNGSAERFLEFFGTNSPEARSDVSTRFESFADYAQVAFEGKHGTVERPLIWFCKEYGYLEESGAQSFCTAGGSKRYIAYAIYNYGKIVNCPLYYLLPSQTEECPGSLIDPIPRTRELTNIHELSHLTAVFSSLHKKCPMCIPFRGAADHAYLNDRKNGKWQKMTSNQRLTNADTYAYFAHSVALGCPRMPK